MVRLLQFYWYSVLSHTGNGTIHRTKLIDSQVWWSETPGWSQQVAGDHYCAAHQLAPHKEALEGLLAPSLLPHLLLLQSSTQAGPALLSRMPPENSMYLIQTDSRISLSDTSWPQVMFPNGRVGNDTQFTVSRKWILTHQINALAKGVGKKGHGQLFQTVPGGHTSLHIQHKRLFFFLLKEFCFSFPAQLNRSSQQSKKDVIERKIS